MSDLMSELTSKSEAESEEALTQRIEATNPTVEEMELALEALSNSHAELEPEVKEFQFKKAKDKTTGITTIRDTVQLPLPMPTLDSIALALADNGKVAELILSTVQQLVLDEARSILTADLDANYSNFPFGKVTLEAIANKPKGHRSGPSKEQFEAFVASYVEVMVVATGKELEKVSNAARLLKGKFAAVRFNKKVIGQLLEFIGIYAEHAGEKELAEHAACVEYLIERGTTLIESEEEDISDSL